MSVFPNDPYGLIAFGCWNENAYKPTQKKFELEQLEQQRPYMTEWEYQQKVAEIENKYR